MIDQICALCDLPFCVKECTHFKEVPRRPIATETRHIVYECPYCGYYTGLIKMEKRCTNCNQLINWEGVKHGKP